jgi:hypothetical protein
VAIYEELGVVDNYGLLWVNFDELQLGQYEDAREHMRATLDISRTKHDRFIMAFALLELGRLALVDGAVEDARQLISESIPAYEATGYRDWAEAARCALAYAIRGPDDLEETRMILARAARWASERGSLPVLVEVLPAAACVFLRGGETERAIEVYELARTLPYVSGAKWYEDLVGHPIAEAAASLPPDIVAAAKARCRARDVQATLEELIREFEQFSDAA